MKIEERLENDVNFLYVYMDDEELENYLPLKEMFSLLQFMTKDKNEIVRKAFVKAVQTRIENKVKDEIGRKEEFTTQVTENHSVDRRLVMLEMNDVRGYVKESLKTFKKYNMIDYETTEKVMGGRSRWRGRVRKYTYLKIKLTEKGKAVKC